ncbi:Gfo/Idh/MocA family oxidoreductase [Massilibacterium senegalense]|uniref:Gfo/Idh/MocA family oxidoreductase n=1 Tax=Massilibacterium senegalense TaxID=1632858 RepID=UPI000781D7FE|nr:Gfo/Idh/MocA family oxidoreductase [Massilibacterium senegalense]
MDIAIIGSGHIGSRHLQSMSKLDDSSNIFVVDPSIESLKSAENHYKEVNLKCQHNLTFTTNLNEIPKVLDGVIIATSSMMRKEVIKQLLYHANSIQFLILEKFLFPSIDDFQEVKTILQEKGILNYTYVNCTRREYPFYHFLKSKLKTSQFINFRVSGSNVGLGSNGVHYLDIFSYLINDNDINIYFSELDNIILPSKREGYIEFTGKLKGVSDKKMKADITIESFKEPNIPITITIESDNLKCIINKKEKNILLFQKQNQWKEEYIDYPNILISEVSHVIIKKLFEQKQCNLTPYLKSMELHQLLLREFLRKLSYIEGKRVTICPIT